MLQTLCFVLLFLYVWEAHIYSSKCPPKYKNELPKNFTRFIILSSSPIYNKWLIHDDIVEMIDKVLEEDDTNKDGFLSYSEFAAGRRRAMTETDSELWFCQMSVNKIFVWKF